MMSRGMTVEEGQVFNQALARFQAQYEARKAALEERIQQLKCRLFVEQERYHCNPQAIQAEAIVQGVLDRQCSGVDLSRAELKRFSQAWHDLKWLQQPRWEAERQVIWAENDLKDLIAEYEDELPRVAFVAGRRFRPKRVRKTAA